MRLVKLDIKKNDLGIEPISFLKKDFNHIIALVGKNGSGKSRVLELIKNFISDCSPQVFSKYVSHLTPQMQQLLPDLLSYRATNAVAEQQYKNNLARFRVEVASHVKFIDGKILSNVTTGKAIDINALLNNTYQTNADNNEINGFNIDTVFNHVKEVALDITNDKVFQYLDETSLPSDSENKLKILNEYLFHFLGKQFEYIAIKGVSKGTFDVKLNFSGREFKIQELSPG
ncbi:MAG: methyltransferase protein, partial [Flavipsychrobacter sp.]|nr:methyltransferase protein [Flavipsychrobacter sp.]